MSYNPPLEISQQMSRERHYKRRHHKKISKPADVLQVREKIMHQRETLMAKVKELTGNLKDLNEKLEADGIPLYVKKEKPPKPVIILPDLMAEMLKNAATEVQQPRQETKIDQSKEEVIFGRSPQIKKEVAKPEKKILHPIQQAPVITDYSIKQSFDRPPAIYTNIPSPYGIWTEMAAEQLKKSG